MAPGTNDHVTVTFAIDVPSEALTPDGAGTFRQPVLVALGALSPSAVVARTEYV